MSELTKRVEYRYSVQYSVGDKDIVGVGRHCNTCRLDELVLFRTIIPEPSDQFVGFFFPEMVAPRVRQQRCFLCLHIQMVIMLAVLLDSVH